MQHRRYATHLDLLRLTAFVCVTNEVEVGIAIASPSLPHA